MLNQTQLSQPDIEMSLISIALFAPPQWHNWSFLKADDFTDPLAGRVWSEIGAFVLAGRKPEPRSLALSIYGNEQDQRECTNILLGWYTNIVSPQSGDDYARIIRDLADRRRIAASAKEIASLAENTACGMNAAEIASLGTTRISESQIDCLDFVPAHEIGARVIAGLDEVTPSFCTGFKRLDEAMGGGFYQGRFYGIGARMKSGKSLFMSSVAYQMTVYNGARILYLCLEMGAEESMQRILSMHMGVNSLDFLKQERRSQPWFRTRVEDANKALKESKLFFRSKPRMTLEDLKATIARAGMSGMVDGVIVDYLQLVEGKDKGQSSAEHYDNVAQSLAEAVKRHPIWVLSAAQLNKEGNIRGSEGLLMACDLAFSLNKKEGDVFHDGRKGPDRAWLETMVSRYTPYMDVGSEATPGYEIDIRSGPRFVEMSA